ncbi:MAG: glycosyltransferase family 39 protein [Agriterribacter sp.]
MDAIEKFQSYWSIRSSAFYFTFDISDEIQLSPLNTLYYHLIYKINGYDPYYYHIGSLLIHSINSILLFITANKLLKYFNISNANFISLFTTLIWAIHPINVESVTWISASKVPLYGMFILLSFISFLNATQKQSISNFLFSGFWFLCACLSKEQAIVLPIMFATLLLAQKRETAGQLKKIFINSLWFFIPGIIITIIITCINFNMNTNIGFPMPVEKYSLWEKIIISFYCIRFYLTSAFFPINLHHHYVFPFLPGSKINILYILYPIGFILFTFIFFISLKGIRNKQFYLFCIFSFFIHIGLVLQIFPLTRNTVVADRYMYLPLFFILLLFMELLFNAIISSNTSILKFKLIVISLFILFFCRYSNQLVKNWEKNNLAGYEQK